VLLALLLAGVCVGQKSKPTGVKGKVRVDENSTAEGVSVSVRQGETEVAHAETDRNGRFEITNLAPGRYTLVFRKAGLKTAEVRDFEINANKLRALGDRVFMPVDEGALALLKGSVFNASGHSLEGAQIELARVMPDGTAQKIDGRITNELGEFAFRLLPSAARYRLTAKYSGLAPVVKEVDIEGPAVYRVGLSLGQPAP
jgi:hypothetical protein